MPLERLDGLYHDWKNEIPDRMISGDQPLINYKVRTNWWHQVLTTLELSLLLEEIPLDMVNEVKDFMTHYTSEEFRKRERTKEEDIQIANTLIERLRGYTPSE